MFGFSSRIDGLIRDDGLNIPPAVDPFVGAEPPPLPTLGAKRSPDKTITELAISELLNGDEPQKKRGIGPLGAIKAVVVSQSPSAFDLDTFTLKAANFLSEKKYEELKKFLADSLVQWKALDDKRWDCSENFINEVIKVLQKLIEQQQWDTVLQTSVEYFIEFSSHENPPLKQLDQIRYLEAEVFLEKGDIDNCLKVIIIENCLQLNEEEIVVIDKFFNKLWSKCMFPQCLEILQKLTEKVSVLPNHLYLQLLHLHLMYGNVDEYLENIDRTLEVYSASPESHLKDIGKQCCKIFSLLIKKKKYPEAKTVASYLYKRGFKGLSWTCEGTIELNEQSYANALKCFKYAYTDGYKLLALFRKICRARLQKGDEIGLSDPIFKEFNHIEHRYLLMAAHLERSKHFRSIGNIRNAYMESLEAVNLKPVNVVAFKSLCLNALKFFEYSPENSKNKDRAQECLERIARLGVKLDEILKELKVEDTLDQIFKPSHRYNVHFHLFLAQVNLEAAVWLKHFEDEPKKIKVLTKRGQKLLEEVAKVLPNHPGITKIREKYFEQH